LGLAPSMDDPAAPARRWYRDHAKPVAVVIPTFGAPDMVAKAVRSVRRTTDAAYVRILICDDGSLPEHQEALRRLADRFELELLLGDEQLGFAANCNRGLRAARANEDVVLLNSDVVVHHGWLEALQFTAYEHDAGVVGGQLLYPDGTIQFAGAVRNPYHPEWFDHRFRGRRADFGPANVQQTTLAATGACMYVKRTTFEAVGLLDEGYEMAFEDVDLCLRAWGAGHRVIYAPAAVITHFESKTRGLQQGPRELRSQAHFWRRWGDAFDRRDVRAEDGGLRIVYVTLDTGIGGGHRVIYTHLNGLAERGHHPELWTLADGPPDWFDLRVPVRSFSGFRELADALAPVEAIKVATWWETADWVWEASLLRGIPVYLVQDIETSYYQTARDKARVLASYRPEFAYLAGCEWIADQLRGMVTNITTFTPGLDTELYRPLADKTRREGVILALGRSQPLKDFPLTRAAYLALAQPRPELWLFGIEPALAEGLGDRVSYHLRPSDARVIELLNEATVLLQTSKHEGFCLPALEGMAAGVPVVCTDAHGNRDFCSDGLNCLMPGRSAKEVKAALERLLGDAELRERLTTAGRETALSFAWPRKLDALDDYYRSLADAAATGSPPPAVLRG
jgi:GT2 family glycosyltransferase